MASCVDFSFLFFLIPQFYSTLNFRYGFSPIPIFVVNNANSETLIATIHTSHLFLLKSSNLVVFVLYIVTLCIGVLFLSIIYCAFSLT